MRVHSHRGSTPTLEDTIELSAGRVTAALVAAAVLAGCSVSRDGDSAQDSSGGSDGTTGAQGTSSPFSPTEDDQDPSKRIEGVVITEYEGAQHAEADQRVAYTKAPPDGGRHAPVWADCAGTVYDTPVRNEEMVHALEHGTVWIAYDPDTVRGDDLAQLADRVDGAPYMMLSPYPGLDTPVSLQSWGHQLKLDDPADPRVDQFVAALRENPYTSPEPGARCDSEGTGFDLANPPPFDTEPPGPGALPPDGS